MGHGGTVRLTNVTDERWRRAHQHSYQMNSWDFPETIEPGAEEYCYVEWEETWWVDQTHDGGEVRYRLEDSGYEFELRARCGDDGRIIRLVNLSLPSHLWGYETADVPAGWIHDGTVALMVPNLVGIGLFKPQRAW